MKTFGGLLNDGWSKKPKAGESREKDRLTEAPPLCLSTGETMPTGSMIFPTRSKGQHIENSIYFTISPSIFEARRVPGIKKSFSFGNPLFFDFGNEIFNKFYGNSPLCLEGTYPIKPFPSPFSGRSLSPQSGPTTWIDGIARGMQNMEVPRIKSDSLS